MKIFELPCRIQSHGRQLHKPTITKKGALGSYGDEHVVPQGPLTNPSH